MDNPFFRTQMLLGKPAMEKLAQARVAVFGIGGVGGYVAEALARSGVGSLDLIDHDTVSVSNLNRQIIATRRTIDQLKVEAARERVADIAPDCVVRTYPVFYTPDTKDQFDFHQYDYVVDAIDTVSSKLILVQEAQQAGTPIISCMGTGDKLDPTALTITDISKTSMCPLARVMRKELRKRGIHHLTVVYSTEEAISPDGWEEEAAALGKRQIPGSTAFVPAAAGLIAASKVVRDLAGK